MLRLLKALAHQKGPLSFEVVVVEDQENPVYRFPAFPYPLQHVVSGGKGPAAARNLGVQRARGRWILFLDDDVEPGPDLISKTVTLLKSFGHQPVGLVGRVEWHPDIPLNAFRWWLDHGGPLFAFHRLKHGEVISGRFLSTACFAAPRDLMRAFPFDETFPYPAYEDWDLGLRLEKAGVLLVYREDLTVWHRTTPTLDTYRMRAWKVGYSRPLLVARHPEVRTWLERMPGGVHIGWILTQILGTMGYPFAKVAEFLPPPFAMLGKPWFVMVYRKAFFEGYRTFLSGG